MTEHDSQIRVNLDLNSLPRTIMAFLSGQ